MAELLEQSRGQVIGSLGSEAEKSARNYFEAWRLGRVADEEVDTNAINRHSSAP